ncbi:uncharacterized protein PV07_08107 [Cladophialophora immunda]|uniref:Uncharacterized protein n=1 Tax=Cladophialophora immunda TaxID=569365 RepID=A0A0D1ZKC3_9EURO|nr:uncharacterized protein PV07_08107 [Cladophialophora immunda]KIW28441.1 hypothetical protein PV07_08107 [Cladophialophora immunda]
MPTPVELSLTLDRLRELWEKPVETRHHPLLPETSALSSSRSTGPFFIPSASAAVYIPFSAKGAHIRPSSTTLPLDFSQDVLRECQERTDVELRLGRFDPLEDAFIVELLSRLEECRRCQWAMEMLAAHPESCASICAMAHEVVRD